MLKDDLDNGVKTAFFFLTVIENNSIIDDDGDALREKL